MSETFGGGIFFMPHWQAFLINVIKRWFFYENNCIWVYVRYKLKGVELFTC